MKRIRSFLAAIADNTWHLDIPRGFGPTTVQQCIDQGFIRTKRVYLTPRARREGDIESFEIAFRITAKGKQHIAPAR